MKIYFLTLEDILKIHIDQIHRYGGKKGIRDQNLLLSAIAQPYSTFDGQYLHKSFYDKAAAYFFHISQNHPFIDGNKRVALVSTLLFLSINNHTIDYNETSLEELTYGVAKGKISKASIALFLEKELR